MTNKRNQLSTQKPVHRSELYSHLISEADGAGLNQKDIVHLTGLLPRDIKRYSCAEPNDIEDNLARALFARSINAFPMLYQYLRYPKLEQLQMVLSNYFPDISAADVAVLIGATKQNAKLWSKEKQPKSPIFLRNMRALLMIIAEHGEVGAQYWLGVYAREIQLLGRESDLSNYLADQASAILSSDSFKQFEASQYGE